MEDKSYINSLFNLGKLTIFLIILGDFFRKASIFFDFEFIRYTAVFKILLLIIYGLFVLFYNKQYFKNKEIIKIGKIILSLAIVFILSNIFPFNYDIFNPANLEYLIRYLFFPITFFIFYNLLSDNIKIEKLFKAYEVFFFVNLILIIVGFVFEFDLFKSYPNPNRFGYSGLMNRTNQISYISIIMILIYYYEWAYLKKKSYLKFLFVILVSLLVGTKRIYFTLIILGIFHFYKFRYQYNGKKGILSLALSFSIILIFWNSIKEVFFLKFKIFIDIYQDKGFFSSLLSFRNNLLVQIIQEQIIPKWNIFNIFFGGADFTIVRPEMELFDLFFFFGIIGVVIYIYLVKIFIKTIKLKNTYIKLTVTIFMLLAFIISTTIPFLFFVGIYYLNSLISKNIIDNGCN